MDQSEKQLVVIYTALQQNGPATSNELAAETGMKTNKVSALCCQLRDAGAVRVVGTVREHKRGIASNLWAVNH